MPEALLSLQPLPINPGLLLILSGIVVLGLKSALSRGLIMMIMPVIALLFMALRPGDAPPVVWSLLGHDLILYQIDPLSRIFGIAFLIAAFLSGLYSLGQSGRVEDGNGMIYAGAAIAAVFCGDFLTLFILFEIMAVSSVWLILARRTQAAYASGMRYLTVQILSGVLLLSGAAIRASETGSLALPLFHPETPVQALSLQSPGAVLILLAFGIKAAFPLLHNWLQDSYPNATHTGTVALSAFTTKLAIYALARCFPGLDMLIWIGAIMAVFPVFFAVIENDLRKVLSYSLNNQLGFMVCAIGVGGALAINGAALHAFVHIIYKALLFMCMGAVMLRVGTTKATELGGLNRTMPLTTLFCIIGAASISAFPLLSGYAAKAFTMSAVAQTQNLIIWLMLLFASAGVLEHSGIKIPWCAFFARDRGLRPREAPANMLLAMGLAAGLCILAGTMPKWLYALAPYRDEAMVYLERDLWTMEHIITQLQLLVFAALAFVMLKRLHLYPPETRATVLDTDWLWRKPVYGFVRWLGQVLGNTAKLTEYMRIQAQQSLQQTQARLWAPQSAWRQVLSGSTALWTVLVLALGLLVTIGAY